MATLSFALFTLSLGHGKNVHSVAKEVHSTLSKSFGDAAAETRVYRHNTDTASIPTRGKRNAQSLYTELLWAPSDFTLSSFHNPVSLSYPDDSVTQTGDCTFVDSRANQCLATCGGTCDSSVPATTIDDAGTAAQSFTFDFANDMATVVMVWPSKTDPTQIFGYQISTLSISSNSDARYAFVNAHASPSPTSSYYNFYVCDASFNSCGGLMVAGAKDLTYGNGYTISMQSSAASLAGGTVWACPNVRHSSTAAVQGDSNKINVGTFIYYDASSSTTTGYAIYGVCGAGVSCKASGSGPTIRWPTSSSTGASTTNVALLLAFCTTLFALFF